MSFNFPFLLGRLVLTPVLMGLSLLVGLTSVACVLGT